MDLFPRRTFFRLLGSAAGVFVLSPLYALFAKTKKASTWVSIGAVESFTIGTPVLVRNTPALMKKGIRISVIVYRQESGVTVLSARCTHAGCTVSVAKGGRYDCPCHGSRFRYDGSVVKGFAAAKLDAVPFKLSEAGEVLLET